jgi:hypothetical protein
VLSGTAAGFEALSVCAPPSTAPLGQELYSMGVHAPAPPAGPSAGPMDLPGPAPAGCGLAAGSRPVLAAHWQRPLSRRPEGRRRPSGSRRVCATVTTRHRAAARRGRGLWMLAPAARRPS